MPGFPPILSITGRGKNILVSGSSSFRLTSVLRLRLFILILTGLIFLIPEVTAKKRPKYRFETDIGYGFPEAIGIKFKYGNQIQAGLIQSFDTRGPGPTGIEFYYHIGKKPRLMDQSPWYLTGGIAGYIFKVNYNKEYEYLVYPRAGKSFYFSRNAGINVDLGPGFPIGRDESSRTKISPVLFTGSITIFIRF